MEERPAPGRVDMPPWVTLPSVECPHQWSTGEEKPMIETSKEPLTWETPAFVEIRMDAEIGSYQDDFDGDDFH
jgi:hypothetical protein